MIRRISNLFSKETSGLHTAALVLASFTFLAQLLGLIRDRLLAHMFGASTTLDIYYAAFRIPDLILVTVASVVSISVLVPFLTNKLSSIPTSDVGNFRHPMSESTKNFINGVFTLFFGLITLVCLIVFFFVPVLTKILFPGIVDPQAIIDLNMLTRIILLSPIILGVSNLFSSIAQVFKNFFAYALCPVFYNIGIIIGVVVLYPVLGIKGLAYGVVLGALLHLLVQVPPIIKKKFFPKFTWDINFKEIQTVFFTSIPRVFTLSTGHIAILFLISLASLMEEGSIAVFTFSNNLQSVPLALIGASYSIAAFSSLSSYFSEGKGEEFKAKIESAIRHIMFWSMPAISLFIILRAQIVRTALGSGQFDWSDTRLTAATLAVFVFSALAQSLVLLFVRAYYATGNTKKPLIINTISALSIIIFSYIFVFIFNSSNLFQYFTESLFRIEGIGGTSIIMLPLSYSIGLSINAILFWIIFKKDFGSFSKNVSITFFQTLASAVIMGFFTYRFLHVFNAVFNLNTLPGIFLQGLCAGLVGIFAGILTLKLVHNRELTTVLSRIKSFLPRSDLGRD